MASADAQGPRARRKTASLASRTAIIAAYFWRHGTVPNIYAPRLFTEWVQWRKLADRSPAHPIMMDKLAAKQLAIDALGSAWSIPTLWSGQSARAMPWFASEVIIKARHGCNQFTRIGEHASAAERQRISASAERWTAKPYGVLLQEWAYRAVPPGLLVEPFVSDNDALPLDYKIYVFGGRATHVQVHLGRAGRHRWILHDRDWRQLVPGIDAPPPPSSLAAMLQAAETLAADEEFLRVDFYEVGGRPLFGEFCLYPGSGLDRFAAPWIDEELGALWQQARNTVRTSAPWSAAKSRASQAIGGAARSSVAI